MAIHNIDDIMKIENVKDSPEGNFYIRKSGNVGEPIKTKVGNDLYSVVCNPKILVPEYAYYVFLLLYNNGDFRRFENKKINIEELKEIVLKGFRGLNSK